MVKSLIILFVLLCVKFSIAQYPDSTVLKSHGFIESNWKKHNHIVDFKFVELEPTEGALGYSYLFKPSRKFKFGARIGAWHRNTGQDITDDRARSAFTYSSDLIANYSLWKFLNIEASTGYSSYYSWARSTNTVNTNPYYGQPFFVQRIGANIIFNSHFVFNIGSQFTFDFLPKNWYRTIYWGIGYKF